jgi:hypothetical protein
LLNFLFFQFSNYAVNFQAVWDSHDYNTDEQGKPAPYPNAHSPHAWVGLTTASLYGLQFAGGLVTFYFPATPMHVRQA